jgi:hypothetical protein
VTGNFQPSNEKQLADTIRGCAAEGRPVRFSGGGLVAKAPSEKALGVWLSGISGVVEIRADDLVATARCGTSLAELDAAASRSAPTTAASARASAARSRRAPTDSAPGWDSARATSCSARGPSSAPARRCSSARAW